MTALPGSGSTGVSPTAGSGAAYSFVSNSDLVGQIDFKSDANTNVAGTTRAFESTRDVIDYIEYKWGSTTVSKYDYASDSRVRRTSVVNTGTAFSTSRFTLWAYDDRSELTSSRRYNGTNIADTSSTVSTEQFTYAFDAIGNRTSDTGDPGVTTYSANNLNQYTATSAPTGSFTYDNDGNMTADTRSSTGSMAMTWDAENRLIQVDAVNSPTTWAYWRYKYAYDYMGRRVRVQKYDTEEGETLLSDEKFVYDAWNLIEVLDGMNSDAVLKKFTWGLDLSGLNGNQSRDRQGVGGIHAAGGIGGLLAMVITQGTANESDDKYCIYFYNANGDIGQLIEPSTGTTAARYEYYSYGGELVASGSGATVNPFRFSTKYWDEWQGYYYGHRYHKPRVGRWLGRDTWSELSSVYSSTSRTPEYDVPGPNSESQLFAFVRNSPADHIDPMGDFGITLTPDHKMKGDCGAGKCQWTIAISAPCDGYLVQEVTTRGRCHKCCSGRDRLGDGDHIYAHYWEAWPVTKNGLRPNNRRPADTAGDVSSIDNCSGSIQMTGEFRFFCSTPDIDADVNAWSKDPPSDKSECCGADVSPNAGGLSNTRIAPSWWGRPVLNTKLRAGAFAWDCCGKNPKATHFHCWPN